MRSRSASDATLTIDGTIADSIGTSSIRSIWAIVRSATMRGAVRPDAMPVAQELGVGRHERGVGVQPGDERLEALGRVGRLELGQLRQELLRTAHLVDDAQLVEALVVLLDVELGDDLEHVPGDPVLGRQARRSSMAAASAAVRSMSARLRARPAGPGILEAVVVALVAVDRRGGRVELEDRLPEPVGEVVDGRRLGVAGGHVGVSCWGASLVARGGRRGCA